MPERIMLVVLAGGLARRMGGGDKCLKLLAGQPILAHVLQRLNGQAERILLNANGDVTRFASWGLPVATDVVAGFGGPLVGVLTALEWAAMHAPEITDVVSVPADGPFLPHDLVRRLVDARTIGGTAFELPATGPSGEISQVTHEPPQFGCWSGRLGIREQVYAAQRYRGGSTCRL
jgi:molybdopterin-guanine dinucleotide biosynthesis protein A